MPRSNVPREERLARQELDDGGPDDVVYWKRAHRALVYHEAGCHVLEQARGEPRSGTRAEAQAKWKAPARCCVLD